MLLSVREVSNVIKENVRFLEDVTLSNSLFSLESAGSQLEIIQKSINYICLHKLTFF